MMKLYNSLSEKIEKFIPLKRNNVSMYVCGITPYDTTHLGHAFTYIVFDTLIRLLRYKKYEVTYVQNVTDIDDDILKRAALEKKDWQELGNFWTKKFLNDLKNLHVIPPTHYVKATDSIKTMISIIEKLMTKGYAYEKNGNVYFEIKKFKDYGKLSKYSKDQMILISKERGGDPDDKNKHDPLDFLLWQKSKKNEPFWESPWSKGRPGWHIECSAMNYDYLGDQIDIHGGGRDLVFPHHESEIAQSESFTGKKPFAKYWMHSAMLQYRGEKMSKSLGNLIMVSDLLKNYTPQAIRYTLLSHYYRKPWEFHEDELKIAEKNVKQIRKNISTVQPPDEFIKMLENDLDAPAALSLLTKQKSVSQKAADMLGLI